MRRSLVVAASTVALATLAAGPALAHDAPSGRKAAKSGSIQLECRPEADPAVSVRCVWSAPRGNGPFRYELFRKVLGSDGRPALVSTGTDPNRKFKDLEVTEGTRYAYKVRVVDEDSRPAARSRVVVVRCCDQRPGRGAGEGKPQRTEKRGPKPINPFGPGAGPKPGERRRPAQDERTTPEPARLALQCRATSENGTGAVACDWSGVPGDKVAGYRLYRKAAGGTPMVIATFPGGGTTSFTDRDVAPATTYWYAVEAKSVERRGTRSNIVEVHCCP